jgi:ribosome modulation factor
VSGARSLVTAELKGRAAAQAGKPRTACPYQNNGPNTFGARWRTAWMRGFDSIPVKVAK